MSWPWGSGTSLKHFGVKCGSEFNFVFNFLKSVYIVYYVMPAGESGLTLRNQTD